MNTIGVDVSKGALDAHSLPTDEFAQFTNDLAGWRAFSRWFRKQQGELVIYEPTGSYHRGFEQAMLKGQVPITKVNPLHARRFAEAIGRLAKTDRIDAAMLAKMGTTIDVRLVEASDQDMDELKELNLARRGLAKDLRAESNRLEVLTLPRLQTLCRRRIRQVKSQMEIVEKEIAKLATRSTDLGRRFDILKSVPGISVVSGSAILAEMPELGTLDNKTVASLAGLAPMNRESGLWKGKSSIRGGRAELRRSLFMPAMVAIRHEPTMRKRYADLRERGKPGKVAIVAVMRKLLILANALIRDDREWSPTAPANAAIGR